MESLALFQPNQSIQVIRILNNPIYICIQSYTHPYSQAGNPTHNYWSILEYLQRLYTLYHSQMRRSLAIANNARHFRLDTLCSHQYAARRPALI